MKKFVKDMLCIFIGSLFVAASISLFIVPHGFISGGISGICLIIHYKFTFLSISMLLFLFNIPIVALGAKQLGKKFTAYSVIGITIMTVAIPLLSLYQENFPSVTDNVLLAAIYAGIVTGVGGGIVFRSGGTLGGTDILAVIVKKKYNISIGNFLLYCNIAVMVLSLILFKPEIIMYTLISMYVSSVVTDKIQEGVNTKTTVFIVSDKYQEVADKILSVLHRGVTYLNAEGAFLHSEKKVIMCVTKKFELSKLKNLILEIDSNAFVSISETSEVLGRGF